MYRISRKEVLMPGGIELTREAERHVRLQAETRLLSVACGTGELELYLADKYGCQVVGVDLSEAFIRSARGKAAARALDDRVAFEVGDGNALAFEDASFDLLFCSGALCAFYDNGLREFHRVLQPGGQCIVLEIVWRHERVPPPVVQRWAGETAHVLTLAGNCEAFERRGFRVLHAQAYHEPSWWEAYYCDRGDAPHWIEERDTYRRDREHLGVGLFCLEKE